MKPGDIAYIIETNNQIREVEIIKETDGFVTLRYGYTDPHYIPGGKHHMTSKGGMRLRKNRVFEDRETAEKYIRNKKMAEDSIETVKILQKLK